MSATCFADPSPAADDEIRFLLDDIAGSTYTFVRNGKGYEGATAAEHLGAKYDHLKGKIATAEDFIRLCATRSGLSGKDYLVRTGPGREMRCADWLEGELSLRRRGAR